ncbi:hypothetical protein D3C76_226660 [compost metagenome]
MNSIQKPEEELDFNFNYALQVHIAVHMAHALERMVIHDGLVYRGHVNLFNQRLLVALNHSCEIFVSGINLVLTEDEKYHICEMLNEEYIGIG